MKKSGIIIAIVGALVVATMVLKLQAQPTPENPQSEIVALKSQLAAAQARIVALEADAHKMPVQVGRRKALLGDGYVIQIENSSTGTLPVKVTLTSPTFGKTSEFDLVLSPAHIVATSKEIGHAQGWTASPGDQVLIESTGYVPIKKQLVE